MNIDKAAQKLADCMDYPWEFMPEQGRENLRNHVKAIFEAANSAPAEHVRAVGEEPARNEQTVYLILFDDYDVRPETVIGEAAARQRYAQLSNSWNAHLFVKLESNSRDDAHANSNYRHPQRPVVFPERKNETDPDFFSGPYVNHDFDEDRGYAEGWNACIDEFERLNK